VGHGDLAFHSGRLVEPTRIKVYPFEKAQ
jgi:hypothetical protein